MSKYKLGDKLYLLRVFDTYTDKVMDVNDYVRKYGAWIYFDIIEITYAKEGPIYDPSISKVFTINNLYIDSDGDAYVHLESITDLDTFVMLQGRKSRGRILNWILNLFRRNLPNIKTYGLESMIEYHYKAAHAEQSGVSEYLDAMRILLSIRTSCIRSNIVSKLSADAQRILNDVEYQ